MNLSPIIGRVEAKLAYDVLRKCLKTGARPFKRNLGWPGAHGTFTVYWQDAYRLWATFGIEGRSRYWCSFGTMDPREHPASLEVTCEINAPIVGVNRRCAGIFLKDSGSGLYLAHSGKVGGERKGIGKTNFLRQYSGSLEEIERPDGVTADVVLLGKIGGGSFIKNLSEYVHAVEAFKADATGLTPAWRSCKDISGMRVCLGFGGRSCFPHNQCRMLMDWRVNNEARHGTDSRTSICSGVP